MRVVLLLVDALKSEYLTQEGMPFLYSMAHANFYVQKIVPGVGFCERSEILSGVSPATSGNFTAIGFDPARSEYRRFSHIAKLFTMMDSISPRLARRGMRAYCKITKKNMKPYRIPPISLRNYVLTEDGPYRYGDSDESLLTALSKAGKAYTLSAFTSLGANGHLVSPAEFPSFIDSSEKIDFIPLYYGAIDSFGHLLEGDADGMAPHLKQVDSLISTIYTQCAKAPEKTALAVLGDHGMIPVRQTVDIKRRMEALGLKLGRDYEMFLDSTCARFWCQDAEAKTRIVRALEDVPPNLGKILSIDEGLALGVPMNTRGSGGERLYGDVLWYAEAGTLISPDYFNPPGKALRGMHGYLKPPEQDGCGLLVAAWNGCGKKERAFGRLMDVCPTLCELMGLGYPQNCEGVSLL